MQQLKRSNWFRAIAAFLLMAFGVSPSLLSGQPEDDAAAMSAMPPSCPVTKPNGKQPPIGKNAFGRGPGGHGNDEFWTNVWTWGESVVLVPPTHVQQNGSLGSMKWPWWRGVPGELTIAGHRLDADAPPLHADIPDGYGETGFQASGLIFPTTGCWQVTGRVGDVSLTFVVLVKRVNATGTPIAEEQVEIAPSLAGKATPENG
jgi:hypothetical protein